jgi:hypothetical protein
MRAVSGGVHCRGGVFRQKKLTRQRPFGKELETSAQDQ